ncbi:MAG: hypothetical protein J5621_02475 [Paludibacteraceae bacterium]|nr:hypothetical protein [Paludibacteraceae bacterium]
MQRITKSQLALNLNRAIAAEVGLPGLNILIFGWLKHRHYGHQYRDKLYHRDWLFITEVMDLSEYAQYDLSH